MKDWHECGKAMTIMHQRHGWDYMYRQLAEECAELSQAALKLVRAVKGETPLDYEQAAQRFVEEAADAWLMICIARTDFTPAERQAFDEIVDAKYARMMARLEDAREPEKKPNLMERMEDDLK